MITRHDTKGITVTMTAATLPGGEPAAEEARAAQLRYIQPGQLTAIRFPLGDAHLNAVLGGEGDWVEAAGWTQAEDTFIAPDGTRWDFTAVKTVPGDRASVTYHGWLIPARPLMAAAAAEWLPDPVAQLRAAEDLIRDAHPAGDPVWDFWRHLADLFNYTASIAADMTGGRPPMTWSRWNRIVSIARGYLAAAAAGDLS